MFNPSFRKGFSVIPQVFSKREVVEVALTILDEGVEVGKRNTLNFIGDLVTATDDAVNNRINVTISNPTWAQVDKITSSIADITTRSHTALSDIGTNTHAQVDTHLANTSNPHTTTLQQAYDAGQNIDLTNPLTIKTDAAVEIVNVAQNKTGGEYSTITESTGISYDFTLDNVRTGFKIYMKTTGTLISITKFSGVNAAMAGIKDAAQTTIDTASFVGNVATFSTPISVTTDTYYYVYVYNDSSNYYAGYKSQSFPKIGTYLDWYRGYYDTSESSSYAYSIASLQLNVYVPPVYDPKVNITGKLYENNNLIQPPTLQKAYDGGNSISVPFKSTLTITSADNRIFYFYAGEENNPIYTHQLTPQYGNTSDLGQPSNRWKNIYISGYPILTTHTPESASATGTTGMIAWDADYLYVCTATNTWKRVAIATW